MSKARGIKNFHKRIPSRPQKSDKSQTAKSRDDDTDLRKIIRAQSAEIKDMKKMMIEMKSMLLAQQKIIDMHSKLFQ